MSVFQGSSITDRIVYSHAVTQASIGLINPAKGWIPRVLACHNIKSSRCTRTRGNAVTSHDVTSLARRCLRGSPDGFAERSQDRHHRHSCYAEKELASSPLEHKTHPECIEGLDLSSAPAWSIRVSNVALYPRTTSLDGLGCAWTRYMGPRVGTKKDVRRVLIQYPSIRIWRSNASAFTTRTPKEIVTIGIDAKVSKIHCKLVPSLSPYTYHCPLKNGVTPEWSHIHWRRQAWD